YTNENQIIDALDTARLVIDLRDDPDLYTQIAALSSGIPQINKVHTNYVEHQKNGWIISDSTELNNAIDYYFDGLMNWNKSLVYSVKKMGDYTSGKILQRWRKLLEKE
ncbi:TPA: accessory Sec system protein Asp1, partial [Streptococcus agalactiae]|nr:accessory Sec system protein Asp1 [Streptococcus agalactiae]